MHTTHAVKAVGDRSQDQGEQVLVVKAKQIKLGIDVHADNVRVVRQIDDANPQPAQKFTHEKFLSWAKKQTTLAENVWSCYEAGAFGFVLHRQLVALGVNNLVICPQNWDERGKGVKTDQLDALAMVQRLDRYVHGNRTALAVVRVPSEAEEQARWVSRLREQVRRHRQRLEAQGRCLLLTQGVHVSGRWWQQARWKLLAAQLPEALVAVLAVTRTLAQAAHEQVEALTAQLEAAAPSRRPRGLGGLTREVLHREMGDWSRCRNRRQIASLTGLCPGVYSTNQRTRMGSITKHGNPRLRHALVELAWRVVKWQPQYPPVARWRRLLLDHRAPKAAKKKAIVAIARRLAIDLWRLETGRCRAEQLQWVMVG